MVSPEVQKSQKEIWGKRIRNGGIIAGLIGLIMRSAGFVVVGGGLFAGGEILKNTGKKLQSKSA